MSDNFINLFTCPYIHNKMLHLITTATTCIHQMVLKYVPGHYKWGNGLYSYAHPVFQESSHLSDSQKKERVHTFPMSPNMITRCKEF